MQKFVKILILTSCIFLALVKTAGAHLYIQNALHRTQAYVSMQNDMTMLEGASKGSEQKEPNLKINLSSHILGGVYENAFVIAVSEEENNFHADIFAEFLPPPPSSIFRPPRLS